MAEFLKRALGWIKYAVGVSILFVLFGALAIFRKTGDLIKRIIP